MAAAERIRRVLEHLVGGVVRDDVPDLLLGSRCVGCPRPGRALCDRCAAELAGAAFPAVPVPRPAGLPAVWAVAAYDGVARAAVLAHKEHGRVGLAGPLGRTLAISLQVAAGEALAGQAADRRDAGRILVVPVPTSRAAVRRRGYDPLLRITRRAVAAGPPGAGVEVCRALRLTRAVHDQAGLAAAARRVNLTGAFGVKPRLRGALAGRTVVLVDDVLTTGATLVEAAGALRSAGARVPAAAVVAATARRR